MSTYPYPKAIDDLIMLLACRYGANPHFGEEDDDDSATSTGDVRAAYNTQQERSWSLVAEGVRLHLRHPLTDDERSYLRFVDVDLFTAKMCQNRAQYALWREQQRLEKAAKEGHAARPSNDKKQAVSGFSVTRHSIHDEVARLYAQVRSSLPSCDDVELSDTDEDEGTATATKATTSGSAATTAKNPFDKLKQFSLKSQADVDRDIALAKAEEELLAQFAVLQQEHFKKTRRWVDVPQELTQARSSPSAAAPSISAAELNLKAFEKSVGVIRPQSSSVAGANASTPTGVSKSQRPTANAPTNNNDPIQIAKSALNPYGRPPRPSQEYDDEDEDEGADDFLASNDVADVLSAWKNPEPVAPNTSASQGKPVGNNSPPSGKKTVDQPAVSVAPASRGGGRWNIVEYSDDEEDDGS